MGGPMPPAAGAPARTAAGRPEGRAPPASRRRLEAAGRRPRADGLDNRSGWSEDGVGYSGPVLFGRAPRPLEHPRPLQPEVQVVLPRVADGAMALERRPAGPVRRP